ncbi:MAG: flagellar basal body-associated protein FliL [Rhodobacterales bacterium CG2_30_65_12]|nr:MAG: flagellar basal body-associated protein FliL [Rhodobacterales bacterium CG2_30_65_12]
MGKLLPILLALIGLGAGVGAGLALRPAPSNDLARSADPGDCAATDALPEAAGHPQEADGADAGVSSDFVKLNNQFVIPVVKSEQIAALVVLSISLEVPPGGSEQVYQREPKLRDRILQVLFDHANAGGFDGAFTEGRNMETLRTALLETTRQELGTAIKSVLITDIARQDN